MHAFQVDARGLRIRKALLAVGEAVAAYTRFALAHAARPLDLALRAA